MVEEEFSDQRLVSFVPKKLDEMFEIRTSRITGDNGKIAKIATVGHTPYNSDEDFEMIYDFEYNYYDVPIHEFFRIWDKNNSEWKYLMLFSTSYIGAQVLDLGTGNIIAKNSENNTLSFCLRRFAIPDYMDWFAHQDFEKVNEKDLLESFDTFEKRRSFAFVQGCYWGDDWVMKLRTLDLSKVLLGELPETSETFGYFGFEGDMNDLKKQDWFFDNEYNYVCINTPIGFKMNEENYSVEKSNFVTDVSPKNFIRD